MGQSKRLAGVNLLTCVCDYSDINQIFTGLNHTTECLRSLFCRLKMETLRQYLCMKAVAYQNQIRDRKIYLLTVIILIMKKILVLTDLSENTSHLTKAAVMLAGKLHTDILLFNNYQVIPVTSFYGAGPYVGRDETWWEQECKTKLDKLGVAVQQSIHRSLPGEKWQPRVFTQSDEGNFGANVNSIIALKDIELVIMGGSTESSFEHLLFGNKVKSVIDHATCPVLIIPFGSELNKIDNVIFATEFESSDIKAVHYLTDLGKELHYQLNIVHVNVMGHSESSEMERKQIFLSMLEDLDYAGLAHSEVRGKELVERLLRLFSDQRFDLIALVHRHDSLIVRMIRQSIAGQILERQTSPVIVFPGQIGNSET